MFKPLSAILALTILATIFIAYRRSSRILNESSQNAQEVQEDALPPAFIPGRLPDVCETPWCEEILEETDGICDQCLLRHCKKHLYDYDFLAVWGHLWEYTEYPRNARLCEDCVAEVEAGFGVLVERERESAVSPDA